MRSNENSLGNKYDKFEDEDKVVNEIFEDTIECEISLYFISLEDTTCEYVNFIGVNTSY